MLKNLFLFCAFAAASVCAAQTRYFMQGENGASEIPYGCNAKNGKYARAGGAKIYYEVYGEGEPALVLHGGGVGCPYEMGGFIDILSKKYLVIVPSARGHGKSEIGTEKISYEQKANDMLAVLDTETKKPAIIVGFSDGAYTAYKIAAMRPERVKKIAAIGAGEILPQTRIFPALKISDIEKADPEFAAQKLALCPEPEKLQKFLDDYFNFYNSLTVSKETFSAIKCPVLLIAGENDKNAPLDTVISAYKMIPNASLAVIASAPHQAFMANFDAVWANVKQFLEE